MFDIKAIRDNPDVFDAAMKKRGFSHPDAAAGQSVSAYLLALDATARAATAEMNDLQARRNAASKQIGAAKGKGDEAEAQRLIAEVDTIKSETQLLEQKQAALVEDLHAALAVIPNAPEGGVPDGKDESGNKLEHDWREEQRLISTNERPLKEHFDIGEALGQMDFDTAVKMSGSRFVLLKNGLARLERAIASFMLDLHTEEFGYTETVPPVLVKDGALFGTGQLPKFEDDLFKAMSLNIEKAREFFSTKAIDSALENADRFGGGIGLPIVNPQDIFDAQAKAKVEGVFNVDYYLIPTAEVSLTNIVRESILAEEELPLRFTAWTPCFRAEAGAAGRDTRGMIRQHQFSKVELVSITTPEQSDAEHERMTRCAETVLERLELPYRRMLLCAGDMGFGAKKTYDLEVWLPGQGQYREISSCSNCGEFQAIRMKTRCRKQGEKGGRYVHTLNGSGLAVGRTMVAILETYQQADGSVAIPAALQPYMGGKTVITKNGAE